ncbi:MAG: acyl-CoA thioesterase [Clostridiales bacterium]|nr:acyl-CoA thioesterase [Clostridiales bacterium]
MGHKYQTEHYIQYYETDQMGCCHHSNYIRFFEEARSRFFDGTDMPYAEVEKGGILSPVVAAEMEFKMPCRYSDTVVIEAELMSYSGVRFSFSYKIFNKETGDICCVGTTKHCFIDKDGKVISLKKKDSNLHEIMTALANE